MNKKVDNLEYNTVYTMQIVKIVENQTCENNRAYDFDWFEQQSWWSCYNGIAVYKFKSLTKINSTMYMEPNDTYLPTSPNLIPFQPHKIGLKKVLPLQLKHLILHWEASKILIRIIPLLLCACHCSQLRNSFV